MRILIVLLFSFVGGSCFALEGANTLLENAAKLTKDNSSLEEIKTISKDSLNYYTDFKIDNPFAARIFSLLTAEESFTPVQKEFAALLLKNKFANAALLLPKVESERSNSVNADLEAMKAYLFWRLDMSHSFLDQWYKNIVLKERRENKSFKILDDYLTPHGGRFVSIQPLVFSVEQKEYLKSEQNISNFGKELKNIFYLRSGKESLEILSQLPKGHELEIPMGYSAVFYLAQSGRIGDAGKILKSRMEPAIEAKSDIHALSKYYLLIARLLYQAKALEAAKNYYERIPNGDVNYLQAQAELTWIHLHLGDTATLRGKLETLTSPLYQDQFIPESYVVRAISNLRLCQYSKIWQDFEGFIKNNKKWAKKISWGPANKQFDLAYGKGFFIKRLEEAEGSLNAEIQNIVDLGKKSNSKFWETHISHLKEKAALGSSKLALEYNRHYKTLEKKLKSAILKMRFVKIETLDQLQQQQKQMSVVDENIDKVSTVQSSLEKNKLVFPYDGVFWPDEVFRLRSLAETKCHSAQAGQK